MGGFNVLLKLLVLHLIPVCAISPLPIENGIGLLPRPTPPSNVTAPIPPLPPYFFVDIDFAEDVPMKALSFYGAAIWLMYAFAVQPWAESVDLTDTATVKCSDLTILTLPIRGNSLTAGHCVLALHKLVTAVYGPPARYDYVVAAMTLNGNHIGQIIVDTFEGAQRSGSYSHTVPNVSSQPPAYGSTNLTLDDTGTLIDQEYSALRVKYRYEGRHIRSEEIFTAALNGLTSLAPYAERSNECGSVTGVSGSGRVDFHIRSINLGVWVTSCFVLKRALLLISLYLMAPINRFGEMDFRVEYGGTEVATGYVYLSRALRVGEGNRTSGVASS